jgi:Ankyrin repeats (3 copies)
MIFDAISDEHAKQGEGEDHGFGTDDDGSIVSMDKSVTLVSPNLVLKYRSRKFGSATNLSEFGPEGSVLDFLMKKRRQRGLDAGPAFARPASLPSFKSIAQTVSSPTTMVQHEWTQKHPKANMNPNETLARLWRNAGIPTNGVSFQNLPPRFICKWTVFDVQSFRYCLPVANAIRTGNLKVLQLALSDSPTMNLNACNRFGERLIHTAARRQEAEILKYLIHDQNVATRVICESGRTPLHDACWTMRPNFHAIRTLLEAVPDYLRIADNRGFTPLQYIPRDTWREWNDLLEQNPCLVVPRRLIY